MNLSDLRTAIASHTARDDLPLSTLILLAEAKFAASVRHRLAENQIDIGVETGASSFPLPSDFQSARSLKIGGVPLALASIDTLDDSPGTTNRYAILGSTVRLQSGATTPATVVLTYYARPPALTDAAPSNWLLTAFPDVYLYAVLVEYAVWAQDADKAQGYASLLSNALANLATDHAKGSFSGSTLQTRRF